MANQGVRGGRILAGSGHAVIVVAGLLVLALGLLQVVGTLTGWTPMSLVVRGAYVPTSVVQQVQLFGQAYGEPDPRVTAFPMGVRMLAAAQLGLRSMLGAAALFGAAGIVAHSATGRPFEPRLQRYLGAAAMAMLVGFVVDLGLDQGVMFAVQDWWREAPLPASGLGTHSIAPWWLLAILGIVSLSLASAFQRGRRLQEDTDGLV